MSVEERIRYLLRAASRAEVEGDRWVAHLFRRMAKEALPLDVDPFKPISRRPRVAAAD